MQTLSNSQLSIDQNSVCTLSTSQDPFSVFDKYRCGFSTVFSAFRLYSTDVSDEQDSAEMPFDSLKPRGSYRKYTQKQKQMAVAKIMNGHDVKQVSQEYGIPRRNLLRWRKNGCERKEGGGRPTDHQMECILYDKIKNRQINGERQIRGFAIEVSRSQNFKASKGWFSKFCRRYKLQTGQDIIRS